MMAEERREIEITVKVQCDGFGADVRATCLVEHIPGLMRKLREAGVTPANSPYVWEAQGNGQPATTGAPMCPVHGAPMKPSTKGSGWYCTKKNVDGSYCNEKAA